MSALDRLIPNPRLCEIDHVDVAVLPERIWELVRHADLGSSPWVKALFAIRAIPDLLAGRPFESAALRIDRIASTPERPGFQILVDDPPHEVAIGAIGKVWQLEIPFVHVDDAARFAAFDETGWIKVAWAVRVLPRGEHDSRVEIEVRVAATDEASWHRFHRYFRLIGPGSHFIRRSTLAALAHELGAPDAQEQIRSLPADELLPDAIDQITHGITIYAKPEAIWPWLVQMGCRRAGFYSIDALDNAGTRSAREIHPELQHVEVGQIIPATPGGTDGFEVLRVEAPHVLVLGGLFDAAAKQQLAFAAPRPERFWQVTWAFVLEPLDVPAGAKTTRLHVRARATYPPSGRVHATWIRPVHHLMQVVQLRHLAARVEGRARRDDWRDVLDGIGGAARMVMDFLTPAARAKRSTWGLDDESANRPHPGDDLVPTPRWGWTHAIEIDAPATAVWPWVAQIGADRAGFYSYQWLENIAGCGVRNADAIHPEWQVRVGDGVKLHPSIPALVVKEVEQGRSFVAYAAPDDMARAGGKPWVAASWLFLVESLGEHRCRFISRYRVACSDDLVTRVSFGASVLESIGFAMDRRMLLGVKQRAEHARV